MKHFIKLYNLIIILIACILLLQTGIAYPSIDTLRDHVGQADNDDTLPRMAEIIQIISNGGGIASEKDISAELTKIIPQNQPDQESADANNSPIVIATGGTIDMSGTQSRKTDNGISKILKEIGSNVDHREIFEKPPDSTNIGPNGPYNWESIFKAIEKALKDKGQDLTQGLTVPIVFTGAHSPSTEEGSDAIPNLAKSLFVASNKDTPPLVYTVIGDDIFLASNIRKLRVSPSSDNTTKRYFDAPGAPVGKIIDDEAGLKIEWNVKFSKWAKEYTKDKVNSSNSKNTAGIVVTHGTDTMEETALAVSLEFSKKDINQISNKEFGYVEHIAVGYHTSPDVFKFYAGYLINLQQTNPEKRCALVIQGDFSRNTNLSQIKEELLKLTAQKIPVFVASKKTWDKTQDIGVKLIPSAFSCGKARTKLSWFLRQGIEYENLERELETDYMGEITFSSEEYVLRYLSEIEESPKAEKEIYKTELNQLLKERDENKQNLPMWIDHEVFDSQKENIIAFPGMQTEPVANAVERLSKNTKKSASKELVITGFGDGNLPVGEQTIIGVFEEYLEGTYPWAFPKFKQSIDNNINPNFETVEQVFSNVIRGFSDEELKALLINYKNYSLHDLDKFIFKPVKQDVFSRSIGSNAEKINLFREAMLQKYPFIAHWLSNSSKNYSSINELNSDMARVFENLSIDDFVQLVKIHPSFLSQRLIKDSLMKSHPLLKILGQAVDNGIKVNIKSKAFWSDTDTRKYELGNQLLVIGVDSDTIPGWPPILIPKQHIQAEHVADEDILSRPTQPQATINLDNVDQETLEAIDYLWGIDKTSNALNLENIKTVAFSGKYVSENWNNFLQKDLPGPLNESKTIEIIVTSYKEKAKIENMLLNQDILNKGNTSILIVDSDELKTILGDNNYIDFKNLLTTTKDIIKNKDSIIALSQAK